MGIAAAHAAKAYPEMWKDADRPFRGVGGQFLDRQVERNIGQHQHVQRVVGGAPEAAAAAYDLL